MHRPDVLRLFATQEWVAGSDQLRQLGVSRFALGRARRAGVVTMLCPSVVAVTSAELTFRAKARAALLACGDNAFLSGPTSAHLHGIRGMPTSRIEVTTRDAYERDTPDFVTLKRTNWLDLDRDVQDLDGLRVATPLRTLFSLAWSFNDHRFRRVAEDAWHLGLVHPTDAGRYLEAIRRSGKNGVSRMERWLDHVADQRRPAASNLEREVLDVVARLGLPVPERQHPLTLRTGETVHLDIAWPDLRLALEPGHTWWHGGDLAQRRDAGRDQGCAELGWAVHRFDEVQVADVALADRVRTIYQARRRLIEKNEFTPPA
ncbi:MAG: hypothetical protein ACK5OX_07975 [Desertimonas sp.]